MSKALSRGKGKGVRLEWHFHKAFLIRLMQHGGGVLWQWSEARSESGGQALDFGVKRRVVTTPEKQRGPSE
jgi:hypothetical protein